MAAKISKRQDGVPPARAQRPEGVGAVVRKLGVVRHPDEGRPRDGVHADGVRRRLQLLRQRRGVRRRRERSDHGPRHPRARLAALELRAQLEVLLGHRASAQHAQHAEPQVPDAGDRRLARAAAVSTSSTSSTATAPIPNTPIEETVWAMHDIIASGKALYWGTSEWTADEIRAAWEIAERHHLHKPVVEQPQYNLLDREQGREGVRAAVRRHRPRHHDLEPAGVRLADRQVPGRHPGRLARRARRATSGSARR